MNARKRHLVKNWAAMLIAFALVSKVESQTPGTHVVLNIVTRNWAATNIAYSTTNLSDTNPCDGQVWYLPVSQVSGTFPLYRLHNSSSNDYLDSVYSNEGAPAYSLLSPSVTGYAWGTAGAGMEEVGRESDPYHAPMSWWESLMPGYSREGFSLYSYNRYLNAGTDLVSLSAGSVAIASNIVAGGAVWSWTWNGKQFIDTYDYGREMQSALFTYDSSNNPTSNPTEAGGTQGANSVVYMRQGSPTISCSNSGNTQTSRAVPLDFNPFMFSGGGDSNPVIWPNLVIGKDITLDFAGYGNVAKYTAYFSVPNSLASNTGAELPTVYLSADFDTYWTYDATNTSSLTEVYPSDGLDTEVTPTSGATIAATSDGNYAMAIYASTVSTGWSHWTSGTGGFYLTVWNEQSASCTKLSCAYQGTFSSGVTAPTSYVICGTLAQVKSTIDSLYSAGY